MYKNPEPSDEILECFDEQGNIINSHTRGEIHTEPPCYWHGVVNVWIVNSQLQLLCSKRSEALSGNPGKWQTYFGGHVKAGKTFKEAASLELDEEIGIQVQNSKPHLIDTGKNTPSRHFFESYVYLFEGDVADLKFNDGEITEAKWFDMEEYWKQKQRNPNSWCNSCSLENQKKIREYIKQLKK
ncbi:MAG: NUDIX domain-containing protein [bacterium]|nr:NUDIX domain-containing protein [bacterium]